MGDVWNQNLVMPAELLGWELPQPSPAGQPLATLVRRLRESRVRWSVLEPWICFDPTQYHRRVLFRSEGYEMVLNCWMAGQASAIHDHGGSSGASRVLLGRLWETWFDCCLQGVIPKGERPVRQGGVIVESSATIHRVENRSRRPAISLHIYTPPMLAMSCFSDVAIVTP